jgi:hypothetical protein
VGGGQSAPDGRDSDSGSLQIVNNPQLGKWGYGEERCAEDAPRLNLPHPASPGSHKTRFPADGQRGNLAAEAHPKKKQKIAQAWRPAPGAVEPERASEGTKSSAGVSVELMRLEHAKIRAGDWGGSSRPSPAVRESESPQARTEKSQAADVNGAV